MTLRKILIIFKTLFEPDVEDQKILLHQFQQALVYIIKTSIRVDPVEKLIGLSLKRIRVAREKIEEGAEKVEQAHMGMITNQELAKSLWH